MAGTKMGVGDGEAETGAFERQQRARADAERCRHHVVLVVAPRDGMGMPTGGRAFEV